MPGASKPKIGESRHFHTKFKFQLEIDGIGNCQFNKCSELKVDIAKIEYSEGGQLVPYKEPGRMSFSDVTIERAVTSDADLYSWLVDTANAAQNMGMISAEFKRGGFLVQYDRDNERLRTWQLYGAWPMSFTAGSWDNGADELTIESMTLAIDYFVMRENHLVSGKTKNVINAAVRSVLGQ